MTQAASRLRFNCPPTSGNAHATALEFTWDATAGTVAGPGAAAILELVANGCVKLHPLPCVPYRLGSDPLRSWRDMAAIVGSEWQLPPELQDYYPQSPNDGDGRVLDESGQVIDGLLY